MSGTEMQRAKESAAEIMRAKQAAGTKSPTLPTYPGIQVCKRRECCIFANMTFVRSIAEAKKTEGAKK